MNDRIITIKSAAVMMRVPREVVEQLIEKGELTLYRAGKAMRVRRNDVLRWIIADEFWKSEAK
jgi:excisionase family DNA binding protein